MSCKKSLHTTVGSIAKIQTVANLLLVNPDLSYSVKFLVPLMRRVVGSIDVA